MDQVQCTIKKAVSCFGKGLHTGRVVCVTFRPASQNTGIVFRRKDIGDSSALVHAHYENVSDTTLGTTISSNMVNVSTVEHLMAALWGCGIDNLFVDIDGPEVPIMDGSAEPFIFLFECAGIEKQSAPKKTIKVIKKVEVLYNDTSISVEPSDNFAVNLSIDYGGRINSLCGNVNYDETCSFKADLCRARTFGFIEEVDKLRSMGLALGGSLDNAVVVNTDGDIMNEGGLRYNDEFARHKALDLIGDLYLCGSTIKACFSGIRSGHFLNNELLRRLFTDQTAWTCL